MKPRVPQAGISPERYKEESAVELYDRLMRIMKKAGLLDEVINKYLEIGIRSGRVLEVACGTGNLGLEWLRETRDTILVQLDLSPDILKKAKQNAKEYGLDQRVAHIVADAHKIPFEDNTFDGVFSHFSLHEWYEPRRVFDEIHRILRLGGRYCITDGRRDINFISKLYQQLWIMKRVGIKMILKTMKDFNKDEVKQGFLASINACYTVNEISSIINETKLKEGCLVKRSDLSRGFYLEIRGEKII